MSSYSFYFFGSSAISDFRRERLLSKLCCLDSRIKSIAANYFYIVQSNALFDASNKYLLAKLLEADESLTKSHDGIDKTFLNTFGFIEEIFVTPRIGTISPWSSKATDILRQCVQPKIARIERGIFYRLEFHNNESHRLTDWLQKKQLATENALFQVGFDEITHAGQLQNHEFSAITDVLHDRMTESISSRLPNIDHFFSSQIKSTSQSIEMHKAGKLALDNANKQFGLALSNDEINYLYQAYMEIGRDPTDTELTMFAQANSEHCRHKIFNASWIIDGVKQKNTLFEMIRHTHKVSPSGTVVAYSDNAAIFEGRNVDVLFCNKDRLYQMHPLLIHLVAKVETHNHPTAIAPFSGAATGVGGEIRDEGATGCGAYSKAGLSGYICSHLYLPDICEIWEHGYDALHFPSHDIVRNQLYNNNQIIKLCESTSFNSCKNDNSDPIGLPKNISTPYNIMKEAPIGAAAFGNEFGRPMLLGFFRVYEQKLGKQWFGFHKPLMLAGGVGNIDSQQVFKQDLPLNTLLIQIGGPGMRIGIGGGAASSLAAGVNSVENDFASVQRANPEMQRRAQQVIDSCWQLGAKNPILSIHDVGAGGLSNAFPELIEGSKMGGRFYLNKIPIDEAGMSPREIWSNEAQERYVLAVAENKIDLFIKACNRERCPYAIVGKIQSDRYLQLSLQSDEIPLNHGAFEKPDTNTPVPVNVPLDFLFTQTPKTTRNAIRNKLKSFYPNINLSGYTQDDLHTLIHTVLRHPSVASKSFLINIADRTVGGLTARDQLVGPWQVPTSDSAITAMAFNSYEGEVMAVGERAPIAVVSAPASVRMAIGEAITNIASSPIAKISDIKLSANWMAACNKSGQDSALFDAVHAAAMELCPQLGLSIPVGKDSLSMQTCWDKKDAKVRRGNVDNLPENLALEVISPVTLVATAFSAIDDVRLHLTPQCSPISQIGNSLIILIDLGRGKNRLGASIFAQAIAQIGNDVPDLDVPKDLKNFFNAIQKLNSYKLIHAYHDRSDGGLITTLSEMAFTSKVGISVNLDPFCDDFESILKYLFSEELGAVIQISEKNLEKTLSILKEENVIDFSHVIGSVKNQNFLEIVSNGEVIFESKISDLQRSWSTVSWKIAKDRDNPNCADSEYKNIDNDKDPGLSIFLPNKVDSTTANKKLCSSFISGVKPKVAILREQGSNSHKEMAFAFESAGFNAFDVHMTDLKSGEEDLTDFSGIAFVGGFSFGDVLGAGRGWANTIIHSKKLADMFAQFFSRKDTFALGVCNGCQMMAYLANMIPGANHWPIFTRNISEQFEARLTMVEIAPNSSLFLSDMAGYRLPIVSSHGEGFANFSMQGNINLVNKAMYYTNNQGEKTENYPFNPNGSPLGIASVTTDDGRFTIMMPHPERTLRIATTSYYPKGIEENNSGFTPWFEMFRAARRNYS